MSIANKVNHDLRFFDDDWEAEEYDTASVKIPHEYNPKDNYVMVEFRYPSISRQMPSRSFDAVVDEMLNYRLHKLDFKKTDNHGFYEMVKKEGGDNIIKIRSKFGRDIYTFYISKKRKLRGFVEDYYIAISVFLGYPKRDYMRRAPCYNIDAQCMPCFDNLGAPVLDWLDDEEPYKTSLYKYFFTLPGEDHYLCIAYTREVDRIPGTCFTPEDPDYYIVDESQDYFLGGFDNLERWKSEVIKERKGEDRVLYHLEVGPQKSKLDQGDVIGPEEGKVGTRRTQLFNGFGGSVSLTRYNYVTDDMVPDDIKNALDGEDFDLLWYTDMRSFNARNSLNKFFFNHWHEVCMSAPDGWVCGWNLDEMIGAASDASGMSEESALQMAAAYGYETSSGNTDRIFTLQQGKIPGYEYEDYIEKYIKPVSIF